MTEIVRETWHLRAIGIPDEERCRAGEQRHRDNDRMIPDVAYRLHDVAKSANGAARRGAPAR